MITTTFADFFLGSAGASAALIGLLFVAVSIAAQRPKAVQAEIGLQMRASAALLCFLNVMVTSLIALIPQTNVGYAATAIGASGVLFTLASARVLARRWADRMRGTLSLVIGFLALFGFELFFGIRTIADAHDTGAVAGVAAVLVASLSVGVSRAWELLGLPDTGIVASVKLILGLTSVRVEPAGQD